MHLYPHIYTAEIAMSPYRSSNAVRGAIFTILVAIRVLADCEDMPPVEDDG